ncbi:MAG: MFS transporter, partial [Pseudonocardia sp.]|nr:MFS transporter [Pseudonocardia sp.]
AQARHGWAGWTGQALRVRDGDAAADPELADRHAGRLELLPEEVVAATLDALLSSAAPRAPPGVGENLSPAELIDQVADKVDASMRHLGEVSERLAAANRDYAAARRAFRVDVVEAIGRAADGGVSAEAIASVTDLTVDDVRAALGDDRFTTLAEERLLWTDRVWIRLLSVLFRWAGRGQRVEELTDLAVAPSADARGMLGVPRPDRRFWDAHLHHIGYPYPRFVSLRGFAAMMVDDGLDGIYTMHPIPQRIRGLAYYGDIDAIIATRFGQQMLGMRGKLTDAQLFEAHALIPAHLRWHVLPGMSGGRFDIDGIGEYHMASVIKNPGEAFLVAESTLHKENVTVQLGSQGAPILDPHYQPTLARLEAAARALRAAFADGRLDDGEFPTLAALVLGARPTPATVIEWLAELGRHETELTEALGRIGAEVGPGGYRVENVHSRGLREFLGALSRTGAVVTVHNDAGEPETRADGHHRAAPPDRRHINELLAVLRDYPDARVIMAHLGTGKFTTLSLEYLEFLENNVLRPQQQSGAFPNLYLDVSWNDLAQHIKADPAIRRKFVELVVAYPDRLVFGTDGIKPVSVAHYLRHLTEMTPVLDDVAGRGGEQVVEMLLYRNLRRILGEARRDTVAWAAANIRSGRWDEVLDGFNERDAEYVRRWAQTAELYLPDRHRPRTPKVITPRVRPFENNPQLEDMRRWYNHVDKTSSRGRNTVRLRWAALRATVSDIRRARRSPSRPAPHTAPTPGDGVLGLTDPHGRPYTWEALISGDQARRAGLPEREQEQARARTQERQLVLNRNRKLVGEQTARTTRRYRALVTITSSAAVLTVAALIVIVPGALPVLSSSAFILRGLATLIRTADSTLVRIVHESQVERGQVTSAKVVWLARMALRNARHYGVTDNDAFHHPRTGLIAVTRQALADLRLLLRTPLDRAAGETAQDRHEKIVTRYSQWFDQANRALAPTVTSLQDTGPQAPAGRALHAAIAATFTANAAYHLHEVAVSGSWFAALTYGLYAAADVLFGMQALTSAVSGWFKFNAAAWPWMRKLVNLAAFPAVTAANAGLTALFITTQPLAATASGALSLIAAYISAKILGAALLTTATGYLTGQGINAEQSLGSRQARKVPTATATYATALLALGLLTLPGATSGAPSGATPVPDIGDASLVMALPVGAAALVAVWAAVKLIHKLTRPRAHAPPTPTSQPANPRRVRREAARELAEHLENGPRGHDRDAAIARARVAGLSDRRIDKILSRNAGRTRRHGDEGGQVGRNDRGAAGVSTLLLASGTTGLLGAAWLGEGPLPVAVLGVLGLAGASALVVGWIRRSSRRGGVPTASARPRWHFTAYRVGRFADSLGSAVSDQVIPLMARELLGTSIFETSALRALRYVAIVLFALPAGAIADRVNRRLLLSRVDLAQFVLMGSLLFMSLTGTLALWQLYLVLGLSVLLARVTDVASDGFVPELVDSTDPAVLRTSNRKLQGARLTGQALGPALGAAVVALAGASVSPAVDAVSFLVSIVTLMLIRTSPATPVRRVAAQPTAPAPKAPGASIREAWRFLWADTELRVLARYESGITLFFSIMSASEVVWVTQGLHAPLLGLAMVVTTGWAGGAVGIRRVARLFERCNRIRVLWLLPVLSGPLTLGYFLAPTGWWGVIVAGVSLAVVRAVARIRATIWTSQLQSRPSERLRNRVIAVWEFVTHLGGPIGALGGGALAEVLGLRPTM